VATQFLQASSGASFYNLATKSTQSQKASSVENGGRGKLSFFPGDTITVPENQVVLSMEWCW